MISEVVMPQMGADMTEGTLLRWLKQEGDAVTRGEVIAEIETDKANVEIEAFEGGVFRRALATEGDTVNVGEVIAVIAGADEDISQYEGGAPKTEAAAAPEASPAKATASEAPAAAPANAAPTASAPAEPARRDAPVETAAGSDAAPQIGASPAGAGPPVPAPPPQPSPPPQAAPGAASATAAPAADGRVRASPLARRTAAERGVDLQSLRGSGHDGRIMQRDVEAAGAAPSRQSPSGAPAQAAAGAPTAVTTVVQPSRMRQAIARRMSQSKREAPHYYLLVDVDMTESMTMRSQINETLADEARVSVNDLILKACAKALQTHPEFNATITGEEVTRHAEQHVCMAIALDDGLIAPAVMDTGRKSVFEIAPATRDLATRAKNGSLRAEEVSAGTFTVTNLGAYGVETLIGIIQPPQTAILGAGSVMPQPAVRDGAVVVRQLMKVALSADHRVTDGAQGAQFLGEIKRLLERPYLLLI